MLIYKKREERKGGDAISLKQPPLANRGVQV